MPDLNLGTQVFDLVFSPTHDIVFAGLLNGHVKAFSYNNDGICEPKFAVRPSKKTARSLAISPDGLELYSVSKDKSIHNIDVGTGKVSYGRLQAHDSPINRVARFMSMLATGDDDGVIKLWDPRQQSSVRSYAHHQDFITDFLWLDDKKHLVSTSGDGTLSVLDVRSNKTTPFAQSEDQEDELLSAVSIKGHPHSVDALAALTPDVIVTGSSDGLVRVVQLFPHKLLGVIADHGTFPIERLKTDRNGAWLGSASHDDVLKMTDVRDALVDSDEESEEGEKDSNDESGVGEEVGGSVDEDSSEGEGERVEEEDEGEAVAGLDQDSDSGPGEEQEAERGPVAHAHATQSSDESEPEQPEKRPRKRKKKQGMSSGSSKKGKVDDNFFSGL
ncbi:WD repeat-containing protein jip5 [Ceratobasidium sp. 370]|nr:WD repeat-containing protein jip5 [Ceratobasidium sp. 370]